MMDGCERMINEQLSEDVLAREFPESPCCPHRPLLDVLVSFPTFYVWEALQCINQMGICCQC